MESEDHSVMKIQKTILVLDPLEMPCHSPATAHGFKETDQLDDEKERRTTHVDHTISTGKDSGTNENSSKTNRPIIPPPRLLKRRPRVDEGSLKEPTHPQTASRELSPRIRSPTAKYSRVTSPIIKKNDNDYILSENSSFSQCTNHSSNYSSTVNGGNGKMFSQRRRSLVIPNNACVTEDIGLKRNKGGSGSVKLPPISPCPSLVHSPPRSRKDSYAKTQRRDTISLDLAPTSPYNQHLHSNDIYAKSKHLVVPSVIITDNEYGSAVQSGSDSFIQFAQHEKKDASHGGRERIGSHRRNGIVIPSADPGVTQSIRIGKKKADSNTLKVPPSPPPHLLSPRSPRDIYAKKERRETISFEFPPISPCSPFRPVIRGFEFHSTIMAEDQHKKDINKGETAEGHFTFKRNETPKHYLPMRNQHESVQQQQFPKEPAYEYATAQNILPLKKEIAEKKLEILSTQNELANTSIQQHFKDQERSGKRLPLQDHHTSKTHERSSRNQQTIIQQHPNPQDIILQHLPKHSVSTHMHATDEKDQTGRRLDLRRQTAGENHGKC